ncbi:unnamed protein product [Alternaria alternata]
MDVSTGAPPLPGGADYVRLFDRVMESLGSRTNEAYFVLAHRDINRVKGHARPMSIDASPTSSTTLVLSGIMDKQFGTRPTPTIEFL